MKYEWCTAGVGFRVITDLSKFVHVVKLLFDWYVLTLLSLFREFYIQKLDYGRRSRI